MPTYTTLLTTAEPLVLMSIVKPVIMAAVLIGWAKVASFLDKDLAFYFLPRTFWNGIQVGVAAAAFAIWLIIPVFLVGFPLALLILTGSAFGYAYYRNTKVPEEAKWTWSWDSVTNRLDKMQQEQAQRRATVTLFTSSGDRAEVPKGDDPKAAAHMALEDLLNFALPRGAQLVETKVGTERSAMIVHIDGVAYPQPELNQSSVVGLIDYVKEHAGMDLEERRRLISGSLKVDTAEHGEHRLALSTSGSTRGMNLTIEIDPESRSWHAYEQLGLLPAQTKRLESALDSDEHRVVIVSCPPKQGLTTTLYSLLQRHDAYTQSVVTLEKEIAFQVMGFTHNQIEPDLGTDDLVKRIQGMLRQDPQVLMLSDLTDPPVAKELVQSAEALRIYVGMRQEDTFAALRTWVAAVGDRKVAGNALLAIVTPRLIRRLCPTCRSPYKPNPDVLRKLNLTTHASRQFYQHSGQVLIKNQPQPCPDCQGLGYRGRVGVFEVMTLDDNARQLLAAGQVDQLRAHLRQQKMLWIQEVALAKVVDGTTSISEITRVLSKEPPPAQQQAQGNAKKAPAAPPKPQTKKS